MQPSEAPGVSGVVDRPAAPDLPSAAPNDDSLTRAVEEYRGLLKAGLRPDRQEFLDRYSGLGTLLAECLDALEFIQSVAQELHPPGLEHAGADLQVEMPLGDFRIRREIGRGGMGVVYEAEQVSLGRRVALKVLPFASALDARQLQRFKNEAHAAAQLHHTNIVPVYAVGHERGVHFYAMQFIDGRTLADLIQELRKKARAAEPTCPHAPAPSGSPDALAATPPVAAASTDPSARGPAFFRTAATLGLQAAEALEHAHQLGVVHRDIKPANLLVDGRGNLWVTDFGLAHIQGDANLTLTGDLVGTLRYMSPEQALAQPVGVDHRTDIYSLGVTLYELLTWEPAFNGRDRQELLRQIAFDEPRPPRRVDRTIPAELETIVLKAIAKSPGERFATAQELADDLRRFLDDKPIRAKRPTLLQRLRKWARRHQAAVTTGVGALLAVLVITATVLALSTVRVNEALQGKTRALDAETQARIAQARAFDDLREEQRRTLGALYSYAVALAHREWYANGVGRTESLLDECSPQLRHWEWHYLKRLCHADLLTLRGHTWGVNGVAISPDGRRIASGSGDKTVRIWDAGTGQQLHCLQGHQLGVQSVAFSPDGRHLASASSDGTVKLWDTITNQELRTFKGGANGFFTVAFSPDGTRLAAGSVAPLVKVWDAKTGQELFSLVHEITVYGLAFSPDGKHLATADGKTIRVWDATTGKATLHWPGQYRLIIYSLAYSGDGRRLAAASADGSIKIWDATTGRELLDIPGDMNGVRSVVFSPDGKRLGSAHGDQTVKVWDASQGTELRVLRGHTQPVWSVTFSPDGQHLASASGDRTVKLWNAMTSQEFVTCRTIAAKEVRSVDFSPDSSRVALALDPGWVAICDALTGREVLKFRASAKSLTCIAFGGVGNRLAVGGVDRTVRVWHAGTGQEVVDCRGHTQAIRAVAFSPDGKRLASASLDKTVRLWDAATGQELHTLRGHSYSVYSVAFSPDGQYLASGGHGTVRIWDVQTGRDMYQLRGQPGPVNSVAYSRDGRFLASGGTDQSVKVRDATNGEELHTLGVHGSIVMSVSFTPDGQRLAAATQAGAVVLWDLTTGREALNLRGDKNSAHCVAFSPDGHRLACGGADGIARIWDGTPWEDKAGGNAKAKSAEASGPPNNRGPT